MRVFLAGATGAIGRSLLPLLLAEGHEVTGTTRSVEKVEGLRAAGAQPVVCDALDRSSLIEAVKSARPDAVIHELTSIPQRLDSRKIKRDFAANDRLRIEGTHNLIVAAREAGAQKIVAQSVAFAYEPTGANRPHSEEDPLLLKPPADFRRTLGAIQELERTVSGAGGTLLRYGYFYGPGTSFSVQGSLADQARRRQLPIVGGGTGVWSFVHIHDAARATVAALSGPPGVYNVVDDDPAPARDWIPAFSEAVGAPAPMRVPAWLARPLAGAFGVLSMTKIEGASNARAKRELHWSPVYTRWRDGFRTALDA